MFKSTGNFHFLLGENSYCIIYIHGYVVASFVTHFNHMPFMRRCYEIFLASLGYNYLLYLLGQILLQFKNPYSTIIAYEILALINY